MLEQEKIEQINVEKKNSLEDLEQPHFKCRKPLASQNMSEGQALDQLKKDLESSNLNYSTRLLYSFHTSLKINDISPLVVLSGISGTGKSQLPQRYAAALGINYLNMAVQPRWDSPQDIFGFYNYLEGRYKATELTRALIQAERHNRDKWPFLKFGESYSQIDEQMTLILFDEMNLARVEYYLSEFLSKLEVRRGLDIENEEERRKAEISLDLGKIASDEKEMRVYVDRNVLFVGTMNDDESTQSLSDKILDRANMLRFGMPKKLGSKKIQPARSAEKAISFQTWSNWIKSPEDLPKEIAQKMEERFKRLNDAMKEIGRPFGHRTCQAILSYIANYPVNNCSHNCYEDAFIDQIEQRILPKLRNIDCKEMSAPLNEIGALIEESNDNKLEGSFKMSKNKDFFEWNGVERE